MCIIKILIIQSNVMQWFYERAVSLVGLAVVFRNFVISKVIIILIILIIII